MFRSIDSFFASAASLCVTAVLLICPAAQAAPDVTLMVTHQSKSIGTDGIERSTRFSERVLRRGNVMWIERIVPAGAHEDHEHAKAQSGQLQKAAKQQHKHADLSAATRWIELGEDGKPRLRLVAPHDKVVVNIAPAEFSTVGFDGSWLASYHLIEPAILKKLKPGQKTETGAQWYTNPSQQAGAKLRVLWDAALEIPLQVHSESARTQRSTEVRIVNAAQQGLPWKALQNYDTKEYSDFLD